MKQTLNFVNSMTYYGSRSALHYEDSFPSILSHIVKLGSKHRDLSVPQIFMIHLLIFYLKNFHLAWINIIPTVASSLFMGDQSSWISRVTLTHEFTSPWTCYKDMTTCNLKYARNLTSYTLYCVSTNYNIVKI